VDKAVVHADSIGPMGDVKLPEGTVVSLITEPKGTPASKLIGLAGTWRGDDAGDVTDVIYATRSLSERGENL
jgi:hypothetical protein